MLQFRDREITFRSTWPVRRVEWLLAAALFGVGIVYAFADELYRQPLYMAHSRIMPREAWAAGGIIVGALRLAFLYINGW